MRDIKYLVFGLLIGAALALLGATAVFFGLPVARAYSFAPSATATATLTASIKALVMPTAATTLTPTATPVPPTATATLPPSPTATLSPVQALIDAGGLAFSGPLTNDEQIHLYTAAMSYSRDNPADSQRVAMQINGVASGDSSNICGPLAIAILRDAGLLPPEIDPHDFWLLNPLASVDARRLEETFPHERYAYTKTLTPINRIDWRGTPLEPGDFLFIWHGSGGNFDHMLVVSRVDNAGRTYAVTNYGTQQGFIISEAMLYDPNDATVGLFHLWTEQREAILGSTGFGGFEVWRRR